MANSDGTVAWVIYQPLIIGLGAVVLATFGNTLLEWFRHHLASSHAAASLRRALLEELKQAKETAVLNHQKASDPKESGSFIVPVQERYRIYESNINKLGILKPEQVGAAVRAPTLNYWRK